MLTTLHKIAKMLSKAGFMLDDDHVHVIGKCVSGDSQKASGNIIWLQAQITKPSANNLSMLCFELQVN